MKTQKGRASLPSLMTPVLAHNWPGDGGRVWCKASLSLHRVCAAPARLQGSFLPSAPLSSPQTCQRHKGKAHCVQFSAEAMLREGEQLAQVLEVKPGGEDRAHAGRGATRFLSLSLLAGSSPSPPVTPSRLVGSVVGTVLKVWAAVLQVWRIN